MLKAVSHISMLPHYICNIEAANKIIVFKVGEEQSNYDLQIKIIVTYPRYIPNTALERTCCPTQAIIWETLMLEPLDPAMTMFLKELKWFKLSRAVRPVFPRASFRTLFTCKVIKIMSIHYVYKIHVYLWSYQKQNRN